MEVGPGAGGRRQAPQTFSNTGGRTPGSGGSPHTLQNGGGATPRTGGGDGGSRTRDTGFIGVWARGARARRSRVAGMRSARATAHPRR